ncbi:MAG TPA: GNAT family N-acyltransferase [Pseudomonadales bacterium]|nr:GNAT family N-acyltransferase [Pseudomonadales bacterium]
MARAEGIQAPGPGAHAGWYEQRGAYGVRFASTPEDLRAVQALRYDIFVREFGAAVGDRDAGLDQDPLDARARHLMVLELSSGACVGTYRLACAEEIDGGGFYTQRLFDMSRLDPGVAQQGVELARACVAAAHRRRGVLTLLLRGIGAHLVATRKRYLFGCGSVPVADPAAAPAVIDAMTCAGLLDPTLDVAPTAAHALTRAQLRAAPAGVVVEIPALLRAYGAFGARYGAAPAHDPDFGTLDFFVLFDITRVSPRTYAHFCAPR